MPSHTRKEREKNARLSKSDNRNVSKALAGFIASERIDGRKVSPAARVKIKTRMVNTIKKQIAKRGK